jgi:hypothetical protein
MCMVWIEEFYIRRSTIWTGYVSEEIGGNSERALGIDGQRGAKTAAPGKRAQQMSTQTRGYYPQVWKELWGS